MRQIVGKHIHSHSSNSGDDGDGSVVNAWGEAEIRRGRALVCICGGNSSCDAEASHQILAV